MADPRLADLDPRQLDRLVGRLRRSRSTGDEIPRRSRDGGGHPLSLDQERLWFLHRLDPEAATYNVASALDLTGELHPGDLDAALAWTVSRHEALRTAIVEQGGDPYQVPQRDVPVALPRIDLTALPRQRRAAEGSRLEQRWCRLPFELGKPPLMRAALLLHAPGVATLALVLHHIVADGWSAGVLVRELTHAYHALRSGREPSLGEPPIQLIDFAAWQRQRLRGERLRRLLDFWLGRLATADRTLELPVDRPRPPVVSSRGGRVEVGVPALVVTSLSRLAEERGTTLFVILLAAWAVTLSRFADQAQVVVACPVADRRRPETQGLVGFLVNTLVLPVATGDSPPFDDLVDRVERAVAEAREHGELPFARLVEELDPQRGLGHSPLARAMFTYEPDPVGGELADLQLRVRAVSTGTAKADLLLSLRRREGRLDGHVEYASDLFEAASAKRVGDHFAELLAAAAARPSARLSSLALPGGAAARWLAEVEAGPGVGSGGASILDLFARQVEQRPDAVAVVERDLHLTYGGLDRRAARQADRLRAEGVVPGERVGLAAERSARGLVATLAVLRAGAAYVPLDPSYPPARLVAMVRKAGIAHVLDDGALPAEAGAGTAARLLPLEPPAEAGGDGGAEAWTVPVGAEDLAYVMFTSGSTGEPKAVAVPHRAVVRLVQDGAYARFGAEQRFAHFAPTSFDAATFEIWGSLLHGGRLEVIPPDVLGVTDLARRIEQRGVTTLWLTAGLFHQAADVALDRLGGLRQLLAGGDVLLPTAVRRVLDELPACRLINGYGPTENTTFTACHRLQASAGTGATVPIGLPVTGTRVTIVDRRGRRLPPGAVGELCTAGVGLAIGYLGDPRRTAERFVPDPWAERPGGRLYRTGDRGRWLPAGEIEFLGRLDHQVKVRGFRIEPGEVEAALVSHAGVRQAAVVPRGDGAEGRRLVAYVVLDGAEPTEGELEAHLRRLLPPYMLPAAYVPMAALPLTSNDKLDRDALPASAGSADGRPEEALRTPAEERVAAVFRQVLGAAAVGPRDDFFSLGGHSLLAARAVHGLGEEFGVELSLRRLFETPTVAALAAHLAAGAAPPALPAVERRDEDVAPLSFEQERLWFLERLQPAGALNNIPLAVRLRGGLDLAALRHALGEIDRRHSALRSRFVEAGGRPRQIPAPPGRLPVPVIDLEPLAEETRSAAIRSSTRRLVRRPFDLAAGPPWRLAVLRRSAGDHTVVMAVHHIVADGWSMGILLRDLQRLYAAARDGAPADLPVLPVEFADYAVWQRRHLDGEALRSRLRFWRRQLAGAPQHLELSTDRPRPAVRDTRGDHLSALLPPTLATELAAAAGAATPFPALLAAFAVLLAHHSGSRDLLVGVPVANRGRPEIADLIGFFANTVVLRVRPGDRPFRRLVADVARTAVAAQAHQDLPLARLVEELQPQRSLSHTPLFQVLFAFNEGLPAPDLPGVEAELSTPGTGTSKFDLTFFVTPRDEALEVLVEYDTGLFDRTTVERLVERWRRLLAAAVAEPERSALDLPVMTAEERHQVLVEWNDLQTAGDRSSTLDALVVAQAGRTPGRVAIEDGQGELTYAELERRSARLADRLARRGIGVETPVAVSLPRTRELVIALLAVLRTGAAYVPLDPAYPRQRSEQILADSAARLLITRGGADGELAGVPRLLLDRPTAVEDAAVDAVRRSAPHPDSLAYVIYTSGSTGRPKGVAICHRSAVGLMRWARRVFSDREMEAVAATTSVCFDLSVFELFAPLVRGGRVVLFDDALALGRVPAAERVRLVNTVPSAMAELVRLQRLPAAVETVSLAGETLSAELVRRLDATGVGRVLNLYGPSEDTTYSTFARVVADGSAPPIGRGVDDTRVYVLDDDGRPVPPGVAGELFLGGENLARGYLGRPSLTTRAFLPDPFDRRPGRRMYRTGDLVRHGADGRLRFLGRRDQQVKLRGFRIELGEVEAVLVGHPDVREAAVAVAEVAGDRRLVAYTAGQEGRTLDAEELRSWLAERLPAAMVPSLVMSLEALPRTPNGKLDRAALPRPEGPAGDVSAPPRTPTEAALARIFADLLGRERVGRDDDFFALGGHSLLATQVLARVTAETGRDLPLDRFFSVPTVAGLAAALAAAEGAAGAPIEKRETAGQHPLSFAQERLWFLARLDPENPVYNLPMTARLRGALDVTALRRALGTAVRHQAALRTSLHDVDGEPVQRVADHVALPLPLVDLGSLPPGRRDAEAWRLAGEQARAPFDLTRPPLARLRLLRTGDGEHLLLLTMHHSVSDGWSIRVLTRRLARRYAAELDPSVEGPEPPPVQYTDHARWQRGLYDRDATSADLDWWRQALASPPPPLDLPADQPRRGVQRFRPGRCNAVIDGELTARLRRLGRDRDSTLFMVLLAAFQVLLHRITGEEDLLVGAPVAGRRRAEVEELVGIFLNTLALRGDLSGAPTFDELLARVRRATTGAYAHQDVPFERVLEAVQPDRDLARAPLFQVFFNMLTFPGGDVSVPGLDVEELAAPEVGAKFDLTVYVRERGDGLRLDWVYDADRFHGDRMEAMLATYRRLLGVVADRPETRIDRLSLIAPGSPLSGRGEAPIETRWDGSLQQRLAAMARRFSARVAVVDGNGALSYGELFRDSRRLAVRLRAAGIEVGDTVAVYGHRSTPLLVAALGVMQAGAVLLVLDPAYPPARLARIVEQASPRGWIRPAAVAEPTAELADALTAAAPCCRLRLPLEDGTAEGDGASLPEADPDAPAYVMFTSGTTGRPRGIVGSQRPLTHFLDWHRRQWELGPEDRVALLAGLAHDPLLRDLLTPLWCGGTLLIPDADSFAEPGWLAAWMARQGVTLAHLTPATGRLLTIGAVSSDPAASAGGGTDRERRSLPALRAIFFGGDVVTAGDVRRLAAVAPGARLIAYYGTTETPQAMAWCDAGAAAHRYHRIPLGRGIEGVELLVLRDGRRCDVGELGEIHVRTPYLALGYLGEPQLTDARFIANPLTGRADDRVYRSGDLGRHLPTGGVEFAGRADAQVKLRGFRIELAEVEGALALHPQVAEAAARTVAAADGDARLVGYVVSAAGSEPPDSAGLRRFLQGHLPSHMVPDQVVSLPALPLTPNRKLDRAALPVPEVDDSAGAPPRSATEAAMVEVWRRLLPVERVGVHDDFFQLGGHSLLATRLVARVRATFGVELPLRAIFEAPTPAGLATRVEALQEEGDAGAPLPAAEPRPGQRHEPFPLTEIQQAYWFGRSGDVDLGGVASHRYLEVEGDLDLDRFAAAWRSLVERHDMLRAVVTDDGRQRILPRVPAYEIEVEDLRDAPAAQVEERLATLRRRMSHQVLEAQSWPLFEIRAARLDNHRLRMFFSFDYLIADAWSFQVMLGELQELYDEPERSPEPLELSFRDYVLALQEMRRGAAYRRSREYWMDRLPDLPPGPDLPVGRPPAELGRLRFRRRSARLEPADWASLQERAAAAGLTTSAVLLGAFSELLGRWSHGGAFSIVLTLFNRLPLHPRVDALVGDFTSTTLLAVDAGSGGDFTARVRGLQERLWRDLDHRYFSGVEVVRELNRLHRGAPRAATPVVFTSTLGLGGDADAGLHLPGEVVYSLSQTPQVLFDHQVAERDGGLDFNWDVVEEAFPTGMLDDMWGLYGALLQGLARRPERWRERRPLGLPKAQVRRRRAANETAGPAPPADLLHHPFLGAVGQHRERPAVIAGEGRLSYGDLAARAARLGRGLRAEGVEPDTLVAVVMEKGLRQAVAVYGVLAAGAAYLPVDPDLPAARIGQLLEQGRVRLALTRGDLVERVEWPPEVRPLAVGDDTFSALDDTPPAPGAVPDDLAYVIFTSGSTGRPKGVMIEHRAALNTVLDVNRRFRVGAEDRVLGLSALNFDLSVYDLFGPLAVGGAVVLPPPSALRDPQRWTKIVAAEGVTVWNSVPALMELWVEYLERTGGGVPPSLRLVLLSGDWIPVDLPARLRELCDGPPPELISLGGATEASIWSIFHPIAAVDPQSPSIPYGRPLANQRFHVLDASLDPSPDWVTGDLYIAGAGLARGYWDDPRRTAESFFEHPRTGERLYRTGDLGRYLPTGDIEFQGRADFQVKVRGHRIELGEIEVHLARHPAVRVAVADVRGDEARERRLVAWAVQEAGRELEAEALRAHLRERLPSYMVPAVVVPVDELPLTPNGKVDRRALPDPGAAPEDGSTGFVAPRSDSERTLAGLFAEALDVERVGVHDSFFALGGNSVAAILLISKIREEFDVELPLQHLLESPTVASAAAAIVDQQIDSVGEDEMEEMFAELEGLSDDEVRRLLTEEE